MKFTCSRGIFAVCLAIAIASTAYGQGKGGGKGGGGGDPPPSVNIAFRACWPELPPEALRVTVENFAFATGVNGIPELALLVGYYERSDRNGRTAFIYDHFGLIDPDYPQKFWDIFELVGSQLPAWVPTTHNETALYGVNSQGRVCGCFRSGTATDHIGFYVDLFQPTLEYKPLPDFDQTAVATIGYRVNELGSILLVGTSNPIGFTGNVQISMFDPLSGHLIRVRKNSTDPMLFRTFPEGFNSGQEFVTTIDSSNTMYPPVITHCVVEQSVDSNGNGLSFIESGITEVFPSYFWPTAVNEFGQFGSKVALSSRRNKTEYHAARIGSVGEIEWSFKYDASAGNVDSINNSGDLIHGDRFNSGNAFYLNEGDPAIVGDEVFIPNFESLIVAQSDPLGLFEQSYLGQSALVSDRDATGFGWIVGSLEEGVNIDGSVRRILVLLIPEILP